MEIMIIIIIITPYFIIWDKIQAKLMSFLPVWSSKN